MRSELIFPVPFLPVAGLWRGQFAIFPLLFPGLPRSRVEKRHESSWPWHPLGTLESAKTFPPLPSCPFCLFFTVSHTSPALVCVLWATSRSLCVTLGCRGTAGVCPPGKGGTVPSVPQISPNSSEQCGQKNPFSRTCLFKDLPLSFPNCLLLP